MGVPPLSSLVSLVDHPDWALCWTIRMISNFPLFISLVELAEQMHKANVFFAVRILFTCYSLNIINTSFKLHLLKKIL